MNKHSVHAERTRYNIKSNNLYYTWTVYTQTMLNFPQSQPFTADPYEFVLQYHDKKTYAALLSSCQQFRFIFLCSNTEIGDTVHHYLTIARQSAKQLAS